MDRVSVQVAAGMVATGLIFNWISLDHTALQSWALSVFLIFREGQKASL